MERVKEGEKYWYIFIYCNEITIDFKIENGRGEDYARSKIGNYFHTKEEAEACARKLRAVLAGADVIEMPNKPLGLTDIKNNHLRGYVPERLSINDLKAFALGFWEGCDWLALKIVK